MKGQPYDIECVTFTVSFENFGFDERNYVISVIDVMRTDSIQYALRVCKNYKNLSIGMKDKEESLVYGPRLYRENRGFWGSLIFLCKESSGENILAPTACVEDLDPSV